MPGFVIHLAVGKVYEKNNQINDIETFEKGIIAPDLVGDKSKSHYGPASNSPDLNKFVQTNGMEDNYNEGYFLHLVTDYLFYNRFLKSWNPEIYEDYDKLNRRLMEKYGVVIPEEIQEIVKWKDGALSCLDEEEICQFIESVGKIKIRQIVLEKDDCQKQIESEFIMAKEGDNEDTR